MRVVARWIDADKLLYELANEAYPQSGLYGMGRSGVIETIRNAPSIDIVRCSECKHCHYEQKDDIYHCYKLFHRFYDTEHYCSWGEKETDHE